MENLNTTVDVLHSRLGFFITWRPQDYTFTRVPGHRIPFILARVVAVETGAGSRLNLRVEYPVGSGTIWPSLAAASLQMQRDVRYVQSTVPQRQRSTVSTNGTDTNHATVGADEVDAYGNILHCEHAPSLRPLGYDDILYNLQCPPVERCEHVQYAPLCSPVAWHPLSLLLPVQVRNGETILSLEDNVLPPICPDGVRRHLPPAHTTRHDPSPCSTSLLSGWFIHDEEDLTFIMVTARRRYHAKSHRKPTSNTAETVRAIDCLYIYIYIYVCSYPFVSFFIDRMYGFSSLFTSITVLCACI